MTKSYLLSNRILILIVSISQFLLSACSKDDQLPKVDPGESEVTTLVESIAANDALSIDGQGNIYASNFGKWSATGGAGTTILKVTPDGTVSDFAVELTGPLGTTISADGNFYVVNANSGNEGDIVQIMSDGTKNKLATIPGWPAGVISDDSGNLYVSNYKMSTIHKLTPDGTLTILAEDDRLRGCVGIDIDENGRILTGNYNNGNIFSIDSDGVISLSATISEVAVGFGIGYIAYYNGSIYATGIGTHKIYKVGLDGSVVIFAGSGMSTHLDGPLNEAGFKNPNGIAIDKKNKIMYILDWGKKSLRKIKLE